MFYQYFFFLLSFFFFFPFLSVFSVTDTKDSQNSRQWRNYYFSYFHFHPLTNIHLVHLDFLPLYFNRSFCNYQTDETCWWPFSKWHCENLSSYQTITLLLQIERLNQLTLTPLVTTVYLWQLPNPSLSHRLFSLRLPKCIRNEGCSIFLQEIGEK